MTKSTLLRTLWVVVICSCICTGAAAQILSLSLSPSLGTWPTLMSLVQGTDGNLYGMARNDGAYGSGTVFRMTPAGQLTLIYSFCAVRGCPDGSTPEGPLVLGTDGNLYGTTWWGGLCEFCNGTVFKITPQGKLTTLHLFCSLPNCADGGAPQAGLVLGTDGNFYGTTATTVYRITPEGVFTTLVTFGPDASGSQSTLIQGTDGNFYGTTYYGGSNTCDYNGDSCGTVFKMTADGGFTILHTFSGSDGGFPAASLVEGSDGTFYGTTSGGLDYSGHYQGPGTIFKITSTGDFSTLHNFCGKDCTDGANPEAGLVLATDGNFYGTTRGGGSPLGLPCYDNCGTVFQMTPSGTVTSIFRFIGLGDLSIPFGESPWGGVLQSTDGNLYGTTQIGGANTSCGYGCGTVFRLTTKLGPFVAFVRPAGRLNPQFGILGRGFTGTTSVLLNGAAAPFTIKSDTLIVAKVPVGATSGYVMVTTPSGTLTSNVPFRVIP